MPLALLEHVNLNVPDHDAAYAFYVTALGGVVNPKTTNERQLHVNVGASQFHLLLQASFAEGIEKVTIPQVWAGHIELWSREPLETIQQRLTEAGRSLTREEASAAYPAANRTYWLYARGAIAISCAPHPTVLMRRPTAAIRAASAAS